MKGALVTIAEIKSSLRFDDVDEDAKLSLLIESASRKILRHIKSDGEEYTDSSGEVVPGNVDGDIKLATIMLVGILYRGIDGDQEKDFEMGFLPAPIVSLLYERRLPTLA